MDFTVSGLTYDGNGNLTAMTQRGLKINTPVTIDSLNYTYVTNSNRLAKIKDFITDTDPWGDFKDTSLTTNDYVFDDNGNIVKDNNKHIHTSGNANGIAYNFLDKASSITVNGKGNISYVYSAAGMLLQKTVTDDKQNKKTVITYAAGFVYQKVLPVSGNAATVPDTLQYGFHEEGRIRNAMQVNLQTGAVSFSLVYDYFLKDHLGNIRSVVTDEQRTDAYPVASLETAQLNNEKLYYTNLDGGRINKSLVSGYPADGYTNPNDFIQKLNGNETKIGAGILVKVMAGDKLTVRANSWFNNWNTPGTPVDPLTDIVSALTNSIPAISGDKIVQSQLTTSVLNPSVSGFLSSRDASNNSARPKAWFNIVVLDEQLNPVITTDGKNSYFQQVGGSNVFTTHSVTDREVTKNGYVYIYVSNETPNINVFFDNLQVTHKRSALLSESAYYPFGLEMNGISSNAATVTANNYKFNEGTELNDKFDVNYYETYYRNYDAQIGRFTGVDILSEKTFAYSPYHFGSNDPICFNDPSGALSKFSWMSIGLQKTIDQWNKWDAEVDAATGYGIDLSNGVSAGGGVTAGSGGFSFSGASAQVVFRAFRDAYNNSDAQGNWAFTVGSQNGGLGYWESYTGSTGEFLGNLEGVYVGTRFVEFDDEYYDAGRLSSKSFKFTQMTGNMYEAGVSGLTYNITDPFGRLVKHIDFKPVYVTFASKTADKRTFSTMQMAQISAEAFNDAIKAFAVSLHLIYGDNPFVIAQLPESTIQAQFMSSATFFITTEIRASAFVTTDKFGKNTITSPAVWE